MIIQSLSLKPFLFSLALRVARIRFLNPVLGLVMDNMKHLLPHNVIQETDRLLVLYHPRPAYTFHVLLVPKKSLHGLLDLGSDDAPFLMDVFSAVKRIVRENHLEVRGYRLIANGGKYQEFPWLHFHLVAD